MPRAADFRPFTAAISPSPEKEVLVAKQAVLAEHGREVRAAIRQLEPEVSGALLDHYTMPTEEAVSEIEMAIADHEALSAAVAAYDEAQLVDGNAPLRGNVLADGELSADDPWIRPD